MTTTLRTIKTMCEGKRPAAGVALMSSGGLAWQAAEDRRRQAQLGHTLLPSSSGGGGAQGRVGAAAGGGKQGAPCAPTLQEVEGSPSDLRSRHDALRAGQERQRQLLLPPKGRPAAGTAGTAGAGRRPLVVARTVMASM
jgi:hypothetical protein